MPRGRRWLQLLVCLSMASSLAVLAPVHAAASFSAMYDLSAAPTSWVAGDTKAFNVGVTNNGTTAWVHTGYNEIDLDLHFTTVTGGSPEESHWLTSQAFSLPADVAPGGSATVSVTITAPSTLGSMSLEAEMIEEHAYWFPQVASVAVTVAAPAPSAGYTMTAVPTTWTSGQTQTFTVGVTNTGNTTWISTGYNEYDLDLHFTQFTGGSANESFWRTSQAFSLPANVAPGASATVSVSVTAPSTGGSMQLEAEMIKEHAFWFTQTSAVAVTVTGPTWSASYNLSPSDSACAITAGVGTATCQIPPKWVADDVITWHIAVTNTGNVSWPLFGYNEVDLDVHFTTVLGGAPHRSSWQAEQAVSIYNGGQPSLMLDPGQTSELTGELTVPHMAPQSGYLEVEVIKEHSFWFGQTASTPAQIYALNKSDYSASYDLSQVPTSTPWHANRYQFFTVGVTNMGQQWWTINGYYQVNLDVHVTSTVPNGWHTSDQWLFNQAYPIANRDIAPGETVQVNVAAVVPGPGTYYVEVEMIKEHDWYFDQWRSTTVTGTANAVYDMSAVPTSWSAGQTRAVTVTVTNTSGFDWTSTQDGCYSCTGFYLNIHFTDSPYFSQSTSEWLTAAETLSFSLANGQSMTFTLDLTAPSAGTHYIQAVVDDYGQENANPVPPDSFLDPSVGVAATVS